MKNSGYDTLFIGDVMPEVRFNMIKGA